MGGSPGAFVRTERELEQSSFEKEVVGDVVLGKGLPIQRSVLDVDVDIVSVEVDAPYGYCIAGHFVGQVPFWEERSS